MSILNINTTHLDTNSVRIDGGMHVDKTAPSEKVHFLIPSSHSQYPHGENNL